MKAEILLIGLAVVASTMSLAEVVGDASAVQSVRKSGETRTVTLPGGAKMEMVWCAPGTFQMGSPASEAGRISNETLHSVTLTRGFWLGKYEVTQYQWESVMRSNYSRFKYRDNPVENISWHDCEAFMKRIGSAFGGKARLPTEEAWEYACRAGSNTPFSGGDDVSEVAWYDENSEHQTHEVGKNKPNAWGFYDMHGNILEWCSDWYSEAKGDSIDPKGPPSGSFKVLRGGCWFFLDNDCRCAYRLKREPNLRNCIFGFRVASFDFDNKPSAPSIQQK